MGNPMMDLNNAMLSQSGRPMPQQQQQLAAAPGAPSRNALSSDVASRNTLSPNRLDRSLLDVSAPAQPRDSLRSTN